MLKIQNRKPFLIGIVVTILIFFVALVEFNESVFVDGNFYFDKIFYRQSSRYLSIFHLLLIAPFSILLVAFGIWPESKMGRCGGIIVKFWEWLQNRKSA